MDLKIIEAYDSTRTFQRKAFRTGCYAPYVSMLFDQWGNVRVCCQNFSDLLGNVTQSRLADIWKGVKYESLRRALDEYSFEGGCEYCKWQIHDGNFTNAFSRHYEDYPVDSRLPERPRVMEFNLSNFCNLACIMCNGEYSSTLRNRRDHLPPLPRFYDDVFFEDLRGFLADLELAKCLGGEPFLGQEMHRVWDMMIEDGLEVRCHINTNGTVYNAKVERVLENLPCTFQVSMDGITKPTFEAIRAGANFEEVMNNFQKLKMYSQREGGYLSITFCLMRQNWHELADMLLFGDEQDCHVAITPVVFPANVSLYTLPEADLAEVVRRLEEREPTVLPYLSRNAAVWTEQLDRLRNRLEHIQGPKPVFASLRILEPFPDRQMVTADSGQIDRKEAVSTLSAWSGGEVATLVCDAYEIVIDVESDTGSFLEVPREECLGRRADVIIARYREYFGGGTSILRVEESPLQVDRTISFYGPFRDQTGLLRSITLPRRDPIGTIEGSYLVAALKLE